MLKNLSTNQERLKVLNAMRSSHLVTQRIQANKVDSTPKTQDDNRWDDQLGKSCGEDALKRTADAMYASTGDTVWLAF